MTPLVADPYTILRQIKPTFVWYHVLDIKTDSLIIRLAPESNSPICKRENQLEWSRLFQEFVHRSVQWSKGPNGSARSEVPGV